MSLFNPKNIVNITQNTDDVSFSKRLLIPDGNTLLSGLSFSQDPNTGISRSATDTLAINCGGVQSARINTTDFISVVPISTTIIKVDDNEAIPITFTGDPDTGITLAGTNNLGIVCGGNSVFTVDMDAFRPEVQIQNDLGTEALPSYSFVSDPDTGFYQIGSNNLGISTGGVKQIDISSSGVAFTNGISFGNETLSNYDEGTWTPVLQGTSIAVSMTTQTGTYTRIGNCIFWSLKIVWSSLNSSTGNSRITGFPFTASVDSAVITGDLDSISTGTALDLFGSFPAGTTIFIKKNRDALAPLFIAITDFSATGTIIMSGQVFV